MQPVAYFAVLKLRKRKEPKGQRFLTGPWEDIGCQDHATSGYTFTYGSTRNKDSEPLKKSRVLLACRSSRTQINPPPLTLMSGYKRCLGGGLYILIPPRQEFDTPAVLHAPPTSRSALSGVGVGGGILFVPVLLILSRLKPCARARNRELGTFSLKIPVFQFTVCTSWFVRP